MINTDKPVDVEVKVIHPDENEYVKIGCYEKDSRVEEIVKFVKLRQGSIEGIADGEQVSVPIADIFYIESVDDKTFMYLETKVYESHRRLYDLEELTAPYHFIRVSKSMVVNLMKVQSIKPALNGRFICKMQNGEEVIISRKYVPDIKKKLRGEDK